MLGQHLARNGSRDGVASGDPGGSGEDVSKRHGGAGCIEGSVEPLPAGVDDPVGEVLDMDERAGEVLVSGDQNIGSGGVGEPPRVVAAAARHVAGASDEAGSDDGG